MIGDRRALEIIFRAIEAYITARRGNQKSNATINRELELLRRALRLAHDRQLLPSIPKVRVLPENNTRQGFFERPDLEAVVTALPAYLRDFTRFAYLTGWRKGEIISLKWTDVNRDAGAIRLRPEAAKTGRGRTVMLEGDLAADQPSLAGPAHGERWRRPSRRAGVPPRRASQWVTSERPGAPPARPPGSPTSSSTTCAVPRPGRSGTGGDGGDRTRHPEHVRPLQYR